MTCVSCEISEHKIIKKNCLAFEDAIMVVGIVTINLNGEK